MVPNSLLFPDRKSPRSLKSVIRGFWLRKDGQKSPNSLYYSLLTEQGSLQTGSTAIKSATFLCISVRQISIESMCKI